MSKESLISNYVELRLDEVYVSEALRIREDQGDLESLAESIEETGGQPIHAPTVRRVAEAGDGKYGKMYELFAGGRRYAAMLEKWGPSKVTLFRVANLSEPAAVEMALDENMKRKDLTPIEEGRGYKLLLDKGRRVKEIAERFGVSSSYVSNRMRLLDLQPQVQQMISESKIQPGHAEHGLLALKEHPEAQVEVAKELVEEQGDVRDAERLSRVALQEIDERSKLQKIYDDHLVDKETRQVKKCPKCEKPFDVEKLERLTYLYYRGAELSKGLWLKCKQQVGEERYQTCDAVLNARTLELAKAPGPVVSKEEKERREKLKKGLLLPRVIHRRLALGNYRDLLREEAGKIQDVGHVTGATRTGVPLDIDLEGYSSSGAKCVSIDIGGTTLQFEAEKLKDGSKSKVEVITGDRDLTPKDYQRAVESLVALEKGRLVEHIDGRKRARKKGRKRKGRRGKR